MDAKPENQSVLPIHGLAFNRGARPVQGNPAGALETEIPCAMTHEHGTSGENEKIVVELFGAVKAGIVGGTLKTADFDQFTAEQQFFNWGQVVFRPTHTLTHFEQDSESIPDDASAKMP
ncbi:MAG: hypothetical protein AAGA23_08155 [Pseudomonadota bacterium]